MHCVLSKSWKQFYMDGLDWKIIMWQSYCIVISQYTPLPVQRSCEPFLRNTVRNALHNDASIRASKPERVGQGDLDVTFHRAGAISLNVTPAHLVQLTHAIQGFKVQRGRHDALGNCQDRECGLQRARGAQKMARGALGRADHGGTIISQHVGDGDSLNGVT